MLESDYYQKCARKRHFNDHACRGRITLEHAIIHTGRQLNERWAIIPICAYAHNVDQWQDCGILDKEKNEAIALMRATNEELKRISEAVDYPHRKEYLKNKYDIVKSEDGFIAKKP